METILKYINDWTLHEIENSSKFQATNDQTIWLFPMLIGAHS